MQRAVDDKLVTQLFEMIDWVRENTNDRDVWQKSKVLLEKLAESKLIQQSSDDKKQFAVGDVVTDGTAYLFVTGLNNDTFFGARQVEQFPIKDFKKVYYK